MKRSPQQDIPAGFLEDAPKMTQDELARKYAVGTETIRRWRVRLAETGENAYMNPGKAGQGTIDIPETFLQDAMEKSYRQLECKYNVSRQTIHRWKIKCGIMDDSPCDVLSCAYNPGVSCCESDDEKCASCGWNPEVSAKRVEKIRNRKI